MKNHEVAKLLYDIADILELQGELVFKVNAYKRAAQSIESLPRPIEEIASEKKLDEIQGVGRGIAEKIYEFLKDGKSEYYEKMKRKMPMDFESLSRIEGMGPKKIKLLYDKLKIKDVASLEAAAKNGRISKLPGFGQKTEENILKGIEFSKKSGTRLLLGHALPIAEEIVAYMKKSKLVNHVNAAGSIRRMKETIGDIDVLVTSKKANVVIDHFCAMPDIESVIARGPTKASIHLKSGLQIDLRVLRKNEYGAALMYFTGSKEHNIELRKIAIAKGLKLSEYGLFRKNNLVAGRSEEDVYGMLGLDYIEPEMREMRSEVEAAKLHKLPKLIAHGDIRADLQMHTKWSDGANTIEEMAEAAKRLGYEYICITDHVGRLAIAGAIPEKNIDKQKKEIEKAQAKVEIKILHGAEVDIRTDGKFDVSNEGLKKFDLVLASLHSALKGDSEKSTQRVLRAMENPNVDIIAHPTARLINKRPGVSLDIEKIARKSLETGTILEIDAQPDRLDLNDVNARAARDAGCKLVVDTDAHAASQLNFMRLGVAVARRAWCEKKDILNALPYAKFAKEFDIS